MARVDELDESKPRPPVLCCGKCGGLPIPNFIFENGILVGTIRCQACANRTSRGPYFEVKTVWNERTGRARFWRS